MHHYKLVIFDWDGTLMDSVARIVSSMRSAAIEVGVPTPSEDQAKNIIGMSIPEALHQLFPTRTEEQDLQLRETYKKYYVELDNTPTPLFEHAVALLEQLQNAGKYIAVATGKGREGLERVFEATNTKHYFHTSKCGGECLSKPDPQMITTILAELEIAPEHAVVVGDTTFEWHGT
jgi:phosphoglycolate phosphatase